MFITSYNNEIFTKSKGKFTYLLLSNNATNNNMRLLKGDYSL